MNQKSARFVYKLKKGGDNKTKISLTKITTLFFFSFSDYLQVNHFV